MRIEGHPWEQVPSGSTMQPSEQHAGDVASHMAFRAKASRLSGVSENPSFSKASIALIRYGLCFVAFMVSIGRQSPGVPHGFPWGIPEDSGFDEMIPAGPVGGDENGPLASP